MINDHKMYCIAGVFWQMGKYEAVKCEESEDTINDNLKIYLKFPLLMIEEWTNSPKLAKFDD